MSVTINSDSGVAQPTEITEEYLQIQNDNMAIDGSMQRDLINKKARSTLTYGSLSPTDYQLLFGYFTSGAAVLYTNTASNYAGGSLIFTGLPTITEGAYFHGTSLIRPLTVVIRQV